MLEVCQLSHRLGARLVLEHIDLRLEAGQMVAIMGPNGAGKTTLLRLLAGMLPVQSGSLSWGGRALVDAEARLWQRRQVGLLTETPALYEQLSVQENLSFFGALQELDAQSCERRIVQLCADFGLQDRLHTMVAALSKGMKHRVALVRALLHQPRLLLLDEPGSGLDPDSAAQLHDWIGRVQASGVTVVLATHDFSEVQRLGAAVRVLNQRMVELPAATMQLCVQLLDAAVWGDWLRGRGLPVELQMLPGTASSRLLLQVDSGFDVPALLAALSAAGAQLLGVHWQQQSPVLAYRAALAAIAQAGAA